MASEVCFLVNASDQGVELFEQGFQAGGQAVDDEGIAFFGGMDLIALVEFAFAGHSFQEEGV